MSEKNDLFPRDSDFSQLVKMAKRKSLMRNIAISIAVSSLLIFGLFWLGTFIMNKKIDKEIGYDSAQHFIQGANVESAGTLYNYTPFSASVITATTKYVAGVPVPWENRQKEFSILGTSRIVQSTSVSGTGSAEDERIPLYFEGERVIEFYSPDQNYDFLPDDRPLLDKIDDSQVAEMAFSFDAAYSLEEVQELFSEYVDWYWVDAGSSTNQTAAGESVLGNDAFGFSKNRDPEEAADGFIQQIRWLQEEKGDFQQEANRLFNVLSNNGQTDVNPENINLSGIVVSGTSEELKQIADVPIIRTAVLGATADKY